MNVTALTPDELVSSLKTLVARERMVVADIVEHLAEVTRRRLYVTSACTSLFAYCHEVLGIAEEPARHYVTVVYVVPEHPKVLDMLRAGTLHVSGVRVIAPALDVPDADSTPRSDAQASHRRALQASAHPPDPGRAPSAATRREVSERDHDQCTYVSAEGRRCSATAWLEFDHKHELAKGGETSTSNLRIFCRVHDAARNHPTRPGAHPQ